MPKVSFRMASVSRESAFGVETNTARKIDRSGHAEGRLTTAPSGCCLRDGTPLGTLRLDRAPCRGGVGADCPVRPARFPSARDAQAGVAHHRRAMNSRNRVG